jgi:hypothetical protein
MDTAPSSNPFSGLKATLARILSGGWVGLVLHLLYRRRIEAALTALEDLFAQWKAGTLAPPAVALAPPAVAPVRTAARTPAAGGQAAAKAAPRAGRRPCTVPVARVVRAAALWARPAAWHRPGTPSAVAPVGRVPSPPRRRGRCRKNADGNGHLGSSILLRYQN